MLPWKMWKNASFSWLGTDGLAGSGPLVHAEGVESEISAQVDSCDGSDWMSISVPDVLYPPWN